jgi:hypothetical protein
VTSTPPSPKRKLTRKQRTLVAAAVGTAAGLACYLLPINYQAPCHLAAKFLGLALGGG